MNTLPDIIQDRVYKYKHQLEYKHVMNMLKASFSYCGWCSKWMLTEQTCSDCWDEDENTIKLFKIHCSRCGDSTLMDFIHNYLPVCNDCDNDIDNLNGDDNIYEEEIVPKRHHERNP